MRLLTVATQVLSWAGVLAPFNSHHGRILPPHVRKHLHDARVRWHVRGMTVAVVTSPEYNSVESGKGHWRTEIIPSGNADAKGNRVTKDSLFGIASNSKLFTMLSIGLLIERGTELPNGDKLDWDTKIKDILPEWKLFDDYASDHLDITDLGSMRSGVPSHDIAHRSIPVRDMVLNLRNLQPTAELRQTFQYNNEHYFTLAAIVHALTNVTLDEFVQEHVFDELGMAASTYNATHARISGRRTDGFVQNGINNALCKEKSTGYRHMHKSCFGRSESIGWWADGDSLENAGAGGVISSGSDIVKWMRELLDPMVTPSDLLQRCTTPLINAGDLKIPNTTAPFYGMGQMITAYRGHEVIWHTGGVPGQTSIILRVPSRGIAIAVLTNDSSKGPMLFYIAAFGVLDHLLDGSDTFSRWEQDFYTAAVAAAPDFLLPTHPSPPKHGFEAVSGTYEGPGYGQFTLAPLTDDDKDFYDTVIDELVSSGVNSTGPIFVAPYDRTFASHIILTPFDGHHFNWTATKIFKPAGTSVSGHMSTGPAVVTSAGIGMFGRFNSQGVGVKLNVPTTEDIENKATVWFKRL